MDNGNKKFLGLDTVVCISPHPDDVEYSMSGLIKKYSNTQFKLMILTQGTSTDNTSSYNRIKEVKTFWEEYEVENVEFTFICDYTFEELSLAKWVTTIELEMRGEHQAIFCTSKFDTHQEHKFVRDICDALIRSKNIALIEYKSPSTTHEWVPNLFVDIESQIDIKKLCLRRAFITQNDSHYFTDDSMTLFHSDYLTHKRGIKFSEQFNIVNLYQ